LSDDRLSDLKKATSADLKNMRDMILIREAFEIETFGKILKKKVFKEEKAFFDVWMYETNDHIQNLATAFGERYFI
jgi:hypothetical protein